MFKIRATKRFYYLILHSKNKILNKMCIGRFDGICVS
jgi:hypothetical protein